MNRAAWLTAYVEQLRARYAWAAEPERMERYLASVTATLNGATSWNHAGEAGQAAWRAIGGKGKLTLKALRALPVE